jgi:D-mannonate dehydratase
MVVKRVDEHCCDKICVEGMVRRDHACELWGRMEFMVGPGFGIIGPGSD